MSQRNLILISARFATALVIVAIILGTAWLFSPYRKPFSQHQLRLAVTHHEGTGLVWLTHYKGFFALRGAKVEMISAEDCDRAANLLAAGQADAAIVEDRCFILKAEASPEMRILAAVFSSHASVQLIAHRDRGIVSPRDLRGKRVGAPHGAIKEYLLASFLLRFGISPEDISVVNKEAEELAGDFRSGKIDALALDGAAGEQAIQTLGKNGVSFSDRTLHRSSYLLVTNERNVPAKHAVLLAVLRALADAEDYLQSRPQQSMELLADSLRINGAYLRRLFQENTFNLGLEHSLLVDLEDKARWIGESTRGAPRPVPNFLNRIEAEPLRQIRPESVKGIP